MNLLSYLGIGFSLIVAISNIIVLFAIKFNDLKHVQKELEEIKNSQLRTEEKSDKLVERISKIEGKCNANHG